MVRSSFSVIDSTPSGADLETKIRCRRKAVAEFYLSFADRGELIAALDGMNLAWGDIRSNAEAFVSPTARARGTVAEVDDRCDGTRAVVQSPYRFSDAESGVRGGPAYRGEHNSEVLSRWLDASPEEIDDWRRRGVIDEEIRP